MSDIGSAVRVPVAVAELRAMLHIEQSRDDAQLTAVIAAATALCEAFIGSPLMVRQVAERVRVGGWQRLANQPVRAIDLVGAVDDGGQLSPLAIDRYAIDIDTYGTGRVLVHPASGLSRASVDYRAGLANDWNGVPEPVRHGLLRLAAHLHRDGAADDAMPPSAIAALWRPYRRMRCDERARTVAARRGRGAEGRYPIARRSERGLRRAADEGCPPLRPG